MYKSLRILIIFMLIFSFISRITLNISYATESSNVASDSNIVDDLPTEDYLSTSDPNISSVQRVSSIPEANLGLNNILNVILIAIGILLILFAIAILIRLK